MDITQQEATQNDDVSNRENNKNTKESKNKQNKLAANTSVYVRENSPRYRLLQDLKHKVVPVDGYNPLLEEVFQMRYYFICMEMLFTVNFVVGKN